MRAADMTRPSLFDVVGGTALHLLAGEAPETGRLHVTTIAAVLGGPAGSVASRLAHLGARVTLRSIVGHDPLGTAVRQMLHAQGIRFEEVGTAEGTDVVLAWTSEDRLTALAHPSPADHEAANLSEPGGHTYVSSFPGWEPWIESAPDSSVVTDIGFGPNLGDPDRLARELHRVGRSARAVFSSASGLDRLGRARLLAAAERESLETFVLTDGGGRCEAVIDGEHVVIEVAAEAAPKDLMSAGDTVVAGYMHATALGAPPRAALERALSLATDGVRTFGGPWSRG